MKHRNRSSLSVVFDTGKLYNGAAIKSGVNMIVDNRLPAAIDRMSTFLCTRTFPGKEVRYGKKK
jgi:hypothetical protein